MSAQRNIKKPFSEKVLQDAMRAILDFGPEPALEESEVCDRIKNITKKLQEISARIDRLSNLD